MTREEKLAYAREYYRAHREEFSSARKARRLADVGFAEECRERARKWGKLNPEKRRAKLRAWRQKNPDRVKSHLAKRYAITRGAESAELFSREEIYTRDNGRCFHCGRNVPSSGWHLDHIIPVSKGGTHTKSNVCVSCPRCNLVKSDKIEWSQCEAL